MAEPLCKLKLPNCPVHAFILSAIIPSCACCFHSQAFLQFYFNYPPHPERIKKVSPSGPFCLWFCLWILSMLGVTWHVLTLDVSCHSKYFLYVVTSSRTHSLSQGNQVSWDYDLWLSSWFKDIKQYCNITKPDYNHRLSCDRPFVGDYWLDMSSMQKKLMLC